MRGWRCARHRLPACARTHAAPRTRPCPLQLEAVRAESEALRRQLAAATTTLKTVDAQLAQAQATIEALNADKADAEQAHGERGV